MPRSGTALLAFDAQGRLHAQVVGPDAVPDPSDITMFFRTRALMRFDANGTATVSESRVPKDASGFVVGSGRLAWTLGHGMFHITPVATGAMLEATDATGAPGWTLAKITQGSIGNGSSELAQRVVVAGGACDGANRCAVFGQYV